MRAVAGFVQRSVSFSASQRPLSSPPSGWEYGTTSTQVWARNDDDDDVNVNIIPDVDAATLTAVGFGLIALNFFVFANLGDGGIAGVLATIINTANQ